MTQTYTNHLDMMDPRVTDWLFMSSVGYPLTFVAIYVLFFTYVGPEIMRGRPRFNVVAWLNMYNPVVVAINTLLALLLSYNINKAKYSCACQRVDYNGGETENRIASLIWYYHMIKLFEFMDGVALVMMKRDPSEPNSVLHVFHHASMALCTWIAAKYAPGGTMAIIAMINSWVHVSIYTYFKLKLGGHIQGPEGHTIVGVVQIVQFISIWLLCLSSIWHRCGFPIWLASGTFIYVSIFLVWTAPVFLNSFLESKKQRIELQRRR